MFIQHILTAYPCVGDGCFEQLDEEFEERVGQSGPGLQRPGHLPFSNRYRRQAPIHTSHHKHTYIHTYTYVQTMFQVAFVDHKLFEKKNTNIIHTYRQQERASI